MTFFESKIAREAIETEALNTLVSEAMEGMDDAQMADVYEQSLSDFIPGSIVTGKIVAVINDDVIIDIGYKSEGRISMSEFDTPEEIETGAQIEVLLGDTDDSSGVVSLSKKKADRIRGWERVMDSFKIGDIVSGKAVRKIKGGLLIDIGVPVFLPASQIDIRRAGDVTEFIGQELTCKIIKIDEERRNVVLSRRKLLEEDRESKKKSLLSDLEKGEIRRGIVKNITEFGAFVDLGGIDGLLHITDMSWGRVNHPNEVVKIDQEVEVMILDFDVERERISLGIKQKIDNPWDNIFERFQIGSTHTGAVVNIVPYGAFVKLDEGIEGLVHVSEMSWTKQITHPSEMVEVGDEVNVLILDINTEKNEISLGIKQTEDNPWDQVAERYPIGSTVKGAVRNLTGYGAFIELEEGIDGLLHVSDMSWTKKISHPSAMLEKGDEIEATVLSIDQDRKRVALGIKQLQDDPWEGDIQEKYHVDDKVEGTVTKLTSFGAFVEIGENLEGLLHVSEIGDGKLEKPEAVLAADQKIEVTIINISPEERKIGLSLKDVPEGAEVPAEETKEEETPAAEAKEEVKEEAPAEEEAKEESKSDDA